MSRLRLCLIWHMHQPMYRDPQTGEYILPWVRLHATRAYYDMARVIAEFEEARVVVNLVPSLLMQLDEYVRGEARDRFLDLTRKPADDLSLHEREFILRNFFMVDWDTNIRPLPRYWELLHKRGRDLSGVDLASLAAKFSVADLRDLQVFFNLVWMGFKAEEEEEVVRALRAKGREFSESEKLALLEAQHRIVSKVMPAFAAVARSGQAELTVTPFYHPILPLVVDSNSALRALPQAPMPPRFAFPEDAREHVRRGLAFAEKHLEHRPKGMWPAEGSVSPEAVHILAEEGVAWCASAEGNLLRSKPHRDRRHGAIYRPYRVRTAGGREIDMVFRDRGLSDLIGFTYAKSTPQNAVNDFFGHLDTIAKGSHHEPPLVTVALDGENAWEHYPHSGRDFLRAFYRRLASREGGIEPVKPGEFLAANPPRERVEELHSGSWIDSNFRIWIGHPEDNQGWTLLREARQAVAQEEENVLSGRSRTTAEQVQKAKEALYVAEGSDWFWWYGDDFSTDSAAEFDALFRGYLKQAWRALGEEPPARLDVPISRKAAGAIAATFLEPQGFIRPRLDGKIRSYFDWKGAGLYQPREAQGAMFRGEGLFSALHFGFDEGTLYLRLDPSNTEVGSARALKVLLLSGEERREIVLPLEPGEVQPKLLVEGPLSEERTEHPLGRGCFRDIVELGLPFEALGLASGMRLALAVEVLRGGVEVERLPRQGYVSFSVPDVDYERRHWKV